MMKPYDTVFDFLSAEFKKAEVPFVLIAGFAVNYYKVARQTGDIDLMIAVQDFEKAAEILRKGQYKQTFKNETFAWFEDSPIYRIGIDTLFVAPETLQSMISEGTKAVIAGAEVIVPSLQHLIALKLHSIKSNTRRELIDLIDVYYLVRAHGINVYADDFKQLCETYANKEIYQKIVNAVQEKGQ
ncbi:MAG: nucleotidyltransferase family protein [Candidatus Omnitrophica bacterium]|nr:nucleotidyltransferase family protein [Candidatus Omnitrophota bacterium]